MYSEPARDPSSPPPSSESTISHSIAELSRLDESTLGKHECQQEVWTGRTWNGLHENKTLSHAEKLRYNVCIQTIGSGTTRNQEANEMDVGEGQTGPIAQFWSFLREGKFMIQRSPTSGKYVFYPRVMIPGSGETDLEWVEASGNAVVYANTIVPRKPDQGGDFSLALVDLAEGPRILTQICGIDAQEVEIGMSVEARIETLSEDENDAQPVVVFYPEKA